MAGRPQSALKFPNRLDSTDSLLKVFVKSSTSLLFKKDIVEPFSVPFECQDNISIDPGLNNPLACLFFAVDYDGNVYVVGEHYEAGRESPHTPKLSL